MQTPPETAGETGLETSAKNGYKTTASNMHASVSAGVGEAGRLPGIGQRNLRGAKQRSLTPVAMAHPAAPRSGV